MLSNKQWLIVGILAILAVIAYDQTRGRTKQSSYTDANTKMAMLDSSTWKTFRPLNGKFEVLFPSAPQHAADVHPNGNVKVKYDIYVAQERDGSTFIITMMTYPPTFDMSKSDDLLQDVMSEMLRAKPQNELVDSLNDTFQGHPALSYQIKNSDFAIKTRAFAAGQTVYVLTVMDRDASRLDSDFATFTGSFELKDGTETPTEPPKVAPPTPAPAPK